MISRYELHEDYTDYLLNGEAFSQMQKRRCDAYFAVPDRPPFIVPEQFGDYQINAGNWFTGTGHLAQWQYYVISLHPMHARTYFDHLNWVKPTSVPHIPDLMVTRIIAYRIDDYLKTNGVIRQDNWQYMSGYVPLDDCWIEIGNSWRCIERLWQIPEPESVRPLRLKKNPQLSLFDQLS